MTLGQRIQEHRLRLGLSQAGLGEKLGVSRQAVSRWEADGAVPDTDKLIALSRLFGLTLNELLQVENPPEQRPAPPEGAAEQEREAPVGKAPQIRWKALLLAAVCFLAGLGAGAAPFAARMAERELVEPRAMVDSWRLDAEPFEQIAPDGASLGEDLYTFSVQITTSRDREDLEVFSQVDGSGYDYPLRLDAHREPVEDGVVYLAVFPPGSDARGTVSVGFREADGVEHILPLASVTEVNESGAVYTPLFP